MSGGCAVGKPRGPLHTPRCPPGGRGMGVRRDERNRKRNGRFREGLRRRGRKRLGVRRKRNEEREKRRRRRRRNAMEVQTASLEALTTLFG